MCFMCYLIIYFVCLLKFLVNYFNIRVQIFEDTRMYIIFLKV